MALYIIIACTLCTVYNYSIYKLHTLPPAIQMTGMIPTDVMTYTDGESNHHGNTTATYVM